jgi:hypothetical protein
MFQSPPLRRMSSFAQAGTVGLSTLSARSPSIAKEPATRVFCNRFHDWRDTSCTANYQSIAPPL